MDRSVIELIPDKGLIPEVIPLELFLNFVPSSSPDESYVRYVLDIFMEEKHMFSWINFASQDWLLLDPPAIFKTEGSNNNLGRITFT